MAKEDGRADGGWGYGFNKFIGTRLSDRVAMRSKKYLWLLSPNYLNISRNILHALYVNVYP